MLTCSRPREEWRGERATSKQLIADPRMSGTKDAMKRPLAPATEEFPPIREAAIVIAILWLVTLFSQLDRQLPALLAQPLKASFEIGLPGLPLALLLLAIRGPARREQRGLAQASTGDFIAHLAMHRATFSRLLTYPAVLAIIGYGVLAWAPAFFQRVFAIPPTRAGLILGVLVAGAGLAGTLLSDRSRALGLAAARFRMTLVAWGVIILAAALWPLMPSAALALGILALAVAGFALGQPAAPASIQDVVPSAMRGQAIALFLLIGGLLGIGFGPTWVALVTDRLFGAEAMLPYALVSVLLPASLIGPYLSWSGQTPYVHTLVAVQAQADESTLFWREQPR